MTTFAMIFGMLPVALGVGEGAETRSPMGVAVIGGLLTSLFLTLVVVPAAYDLFDDGHEWLRRGEYRKFASLPYWQGALRRGPTALFAALGQLASIPGMLLDAVRALSGFASRSRRKGGLK
jgi:hypothetical protein